MVCARRRKNRLMRCGTPVFSPIEMTEEAAKAMPAEEAAKPMPPPPPADTPPNGELALDAHGRVAVAGADELDYGYRAFDGVADRKSLAALKEDCASAFSARSKKGDEAYSSGSTYWVPASADRAGLCAVERAALDVFELHARKASFDRARSGAEWWTLAMERDGGSVAWHFDRDYSLEGDVNLSPHVATVTYLADGGAPTVVVPLVSPSDAEKPVAGAGGECFACRPVAGKHMSFDGRFLHAAPDGVYGEDASSAGDRVTLLVNVWLDWKPDDADVLPAAVRETLSAARLPALDFSRERRLRALPVDTAAAAPRAWAFQAGDMATKIALRVAELPGDAPDAAVLFQGEPGGPPLVDVKPAKKKKKQGA